MKKEEKDNKNMLNKVYYCSIQALGTIIYLASTGTGLAALSFAKSEKDFVEALSQNHKGVQLIHDADSNKIYVQQLMEYFEGKRKHFQVPLHIMGTAFQRKVWKALMDIPFGKTATYKEIAIKIGNPKALRAVGMANNRNPIAIIVPCHRVIGSNGKLVGFGAGLDIKEKLLRLEGIQVVEGKVV